MSGPRVQTNNHHAFISTVWFVQDVKKPQRYQVTVIGWQSLPKPSQVGAIGFVVSDPSCPAVRLMAIDHTLALDQSELSIVCVWPIRGQPHADPWSPDTGLGSPHEAWSWSHENIQVTVRTEARQSEGLWSEKQSAFQLFSLNINETNRACLQLPKTIIVTAGGIIMQQNNIYLRSNVQNVHQDTEIFCTLVIGDDTIEHC